MPTSYEYELRHHLAHPENLVILEKYQKVFDVAHDAHMAGKVSSPNEAVLSLCQLMGLVPVGDLGRDFLNG